MTTIQRRVKEFLSHEEYQRLLNACRTEEHYLLLRTLWETGGRVSEVLMLRPEDIDLQTGCIILRNLKQRKRGGVSKPPLKRVYLFPESDLATRLLAYCKGRQGWVFPGRRDISKPLSALYTWRLVTGLAQEVGVRHIKVDPVTGQYQNRPAWPHTFRHGAAMTFLRRTGRLDVVRDQLGHRSVQTTEGYAGLDDETRRTIIQSLPMRETDD